MTPTTLHAEVDRNKLTAQIVSSVLGCLLSHEGFFEWWWHGLKSKKDLKPPEWYSREYVEETLFDRVRFCLERANA
jgi:hypothetical protein